MSSLKEKNIHFDNTQPLYASQLEHMIDVQSGEIYGGSPGDLTENKEMVEKWKKEVDSALVFGGLFSLVCAVILDESYEWLPQNPGEDVIVLITQVSQQLVNISHGIPLERSAAGSSEPFERTRSAVTMPSLNVTWFASILIGIGCAAFVTLTQQWARRYLASTQGHGAHYERARFRRFLFYGLRRFHVPVDRLYKLLGAFMRLSLLFYCAGLIPFIFCIDRKMVSKSLAVDYIFFSFSIYATTMVSPFFFFACPYGTPFTALTWNLYHFFMFGVFWIILGIVDLPHLLSTVGSLEYRHENGSRGTSRWRKMLEERVQRHSQWLSDGRKRRVELYRDAASRTPVAVDTTALKCQCAPPDPLENHSENEVEDFALWVLELFDTYARSGAEETILPLISDQPSTGHIFRLRLYRLFEICLLATSATEASEQHRERLRVCLECLWCWVKAPSQNLTSLPPYFLLPSPDTIRRLQAEQDPTAAIIARCFCAVVAKKLAADVNSHHSSDIRVRDMKLESLSAILGRTRMEVESFLRQPGAIDLANIVSLTSNVLKTLFTREVPSEALRIFRMTVDILLAEHSLTSLDAKLPQNLVSSFHATCLQALRPQAPSWLRRQLKPVSLLVNDAQRGGVDRSLG